MKKQKKNKSDKLLPKVIINSQYSRVIKEPQWKRMDEELQLEIEDMFLTMNNAGLI